MLYADWPEGGALVDLTETQEGKPPRVLGDPVVELPRKLRADTTWKAGEASGRVVGVADVTVAAGDYIGTRIGRPLHASQPPGTLALYRTLQT